MDGSLPDAAGSLLTAHHRPVPLLLANVWDASSARAVEATGFEFLATSSHAVADVLGERDDDSADPDVVFGWITRIVRAVSCPVTADLEAGYGLPPAELVDRMLRTGVVGCNLEDTDHHGDGPLVDADQQASFLEAVRAAADAAGVHLVINARVDTFARRVGSDAQQLEEAIARGRRYLAAGADCIYPIGLSERAAIAELVAAVPGPVNVLARPGGLPVEELTAIGVHRISLASGLQRVATERLRQAAAGFLAGRSLDQL
ncbi:MAG TPA: isocitrate lyase/phosphoenolpyruvate mutase family protein [Mycobacteriales bacterium]